MVDISLMSLISSLVQHEACNRGYVGIATLLLDYGATINMPGGDNDTALHDAVYNGRVECARLLVSRGASVDARYVCTSL